ncbi:MAG: hypothetical protein JSW07_18090 [bacterium]|nr:MAG: hypothetical protein JSW07_18090 [bacterium]
MSQKTGLRTPYLCDLIATRRRPTRTRALALEEIIGISAVMWLYGSRDELSEAVNNKIADSL